MSPLLLIPTAWVSLQADPSRAPRFVAAPDGDHSMARVWVPLALSENPTLSPAALMATASASPALRRTVAVPDDDHSTAFLPENPTLSPESFIATASLKCAPPTS